MQLVAAARRRAQSCAPSRDWCATRCPTPISSSCASRHTSSHAIHTTMFTKCTHNTHTHTHTLSNTPKRHSRRAIDAQSACSAVARVVATHTTQRERADWVLRGAPTAPLATGRCSSVARVVAAALPAFVVVVVVVVVILLVMTTS
jgi:hypothetical protein